MRGWRSFGGVGGVLGEATGVWWDGRLSLGGSEGLGGQRSLGGGRRSLGDHMVLRGNGGRISRR